jgi:2-(1,2-epoxy-1,2-dihydrophenyl)acetyl-CoA isomerase
MSDAVLVDRRDGLVTVTFNRPHKKNALNANSWNQLDAILTEVEVEPADRALVLTGSGGSFSSGADLSGGMDDGKGSSASNKDGDKGGKDKGGLTGRGRQLVLSEMRIVGQIVSRLKRLSKPTIAAVDGVAVGVGLGLAMACDLIVASDRAKFSEIFVKRGLALDGGASWSLPQSVGIRRAKQMAFFGEPIDAETALAWGLINEVVPADELEATATEWGLRLASGPTAALSLTKRLLDSEAGFEEAIEDEARAQHICFTTRDMAEGIASFLERREPKFTGQ